MHPSRVGAVAITAGLVAVTARRLMLLAAAWHPDARRPGGLSPIDPATLPRCAVLIAARDEEEALPGLLDALDAIKYPRERLETISVDDGSTDGTSRILEHWQHAGSTRHVITIPESGGKAAALARAVEATTAAVIAVYDADDRPAPDALARLASEFSDPHVAAVSGRRRVANANDGVWAAYAALEADVHQLVTQRAKDRLDLGPAVLGSNCAYRRAAIVTVGGFRSGALLEDSDLTVRLLRRGWSTRFVPAATSHHAAPTTARGWWLRRTRWAAGFTDVARNDLRERGSTGSVARDIELVAFSAGYADRVVAGAALGLWAIGWSTKTMRRVVVLAAMTAAVEAGRAVNLAGAPHTRRRHLMTLPFLVPVDIAASVAGLARSLRGQREWERRADRDETAAARR